MQKKPIGDIGPLSANEKDGATELHWKKIGFPADKVGQERYMAQLFVDAFKRRENISFEIESLPEADHDALLKAGDLEVELQLMEIVISPKRGSPYRGTPRSYNSGKFADAIIEKIKTKRYAIGSRPIWFLLYSTHWAFVSSHTVLYLFHDYFKKNEHPYIRVFVAEPLDHAFADVTDIYPNLLGAKVDAFPTPQNAAAARMQDYRLADPSTGFALPGILGIKI